MKLLWVSPFFLHPTTRGAQIRTLYTLKQLHARHEVYFAALNDPANREGPARSSEYSSRFLCVEHRAPKRGSPAFLGQLVTSLFQSTPLAISRYASEEMKHKLRELLRSESFDCIVCDFLASTPNIPDLRDCILFEHNVETTIFERHAMQASSRLKRDFFLQQSAKMRAYERNVCNTVRQVIAVSEADAARIRYRFGAKHVSSVRTGVDTDYFAPTPKTALQSDLVFCGSMDWLPNIDAVAYFVSEVLPLIRAAVPTATFAIVGRTPDRRIFRAIAGIPDISISGTVDDIRPYLSNSKLCVVPLRIGGGTRLKIYEAMAAGTPVVSTPIGAEGLHCTPGKHLIIASTPREFADACINLLTFEQHRHCIAQEARTYVERECSWNVVAGDFEAALQDALLTPGLAG